MALAGCSTVAYALQHGDLSFNGYIDTSYNHLLRSNAFISGIKNREFDLQQNGFTMQQVGMMLSYKPAQGLGAVGEVMIGRDPYMIAPYGWNPYFGSQTLGMVITNSYLQYAIKRLTLSMGLYSNPMGLESYNPTLNTTFSRSLVNYYAEPGFMLGTRASYIFNDAWNAIVGVNSGWNSIRFVNHYPSVEYGVNYTPNSRITYMFNGISGQERLINNTSTGPVSRRDMIELAGIYKMTDKFSLQASLDYGVQRKALIAYGDIGQGLWQGIAGYLIYQFNDQWLGTLRAEIYDDSDGYTTGVRQNLREATIGIAYIAIKHLTLRAETRHDISNANSFVNASGNGTSNNQQSFALEGLYSF